MVASYRQLLFYSWYFCGLGLDCETQIFLVSVSWLRLKPFQSRSRHWDSDIFSLSLIIETQTFSVLVSMIQIWSRWSLVSSVQLLVQKNTCLTKLDNKKISVPKIEYLVQKMYPKNFAPHKIWVPENFWPPENLWSNKILA